MRMSCLHRVTPCLHAGSCAFTDACSRSVRASWQGSSRGPLADPHSDVCVENLRTHKRAAPYTALNWPTSPCKDKRS